MSKTRNQLKFCAPIGDVPPEDKELEQRITGLPETATIADVLQEITLWEDGAVRKFKGHEKTTTSGTLTTICR